MHGVKRVLVFCILIVLLPATLIIIPLYLRKTVFADVTYPVAESDIIEIRDGISSIFCQKHSLRMNSHFNAFQLGSKPEISTNHKHIRLKKSMTLPDDTLEYWGFYLLRGAKVHLKFCSRYDGSRILVVKGQRELRTCGLLEHNKNKLGANYAQGHEQVKVFFEDITEIDMIVPLKDQIANKTASSEQLMEQENKAEEDLSYDYDGDGDGDGIASSTSSTTTTTTTTTTTRKPHATKLPRKKLKKGTYHKNNNSSADSDAHLNSLKPSNEDINPIRNSGSSEDPNSFHHRKRREHSEDAHEHAESKQRLYDRLYKHREKRDQVYDRKYSHGGNAVNFTETDESNSISSFETGLFDCFNGAILLAEGFPPSQECANPHFLENGSHRMVSKHEITEDGYYYYIFYSDNDLVRNDIHAIFDIYKPTFQYSNLSDSQGCVNTTNCTFPIGFLSDEIVVVEVPTRDGIEHEEDDITYLISTCHPRTEIYAIFPILVLVLILSCSFL